MVKFTFLRNAFRLALATTFVALLSTPATAANVNVTNPTNTTPNLASGYPDLATAIADLNNITAISGPVTLSLTIAQTAPSGGYSIIGNTATSKGPFTVTGASSTNKVIIDGGGNTVTAFAGQTVPNLNDAIFKLIGADFITIQNFVMQENSANTTTAAGSNNMTEWGVALLYNATTNGAQNNTIQNNTISLNRTYTNTFGVYSNVRHSATAVTTTADITNSTTGPNSNNKVYGNTISNVNMGIAFIGSGTAANQDQGNDIGGSSSATGNTISNWGGAAAASGYISNSGTSYCIFVNHQVGENVSYNTITSATVSGTSVTLRGIFKDYTTTAPTVTGTSTIGNNQITITDNFTSGTLECVRSQGMTTLSGSTININTNTILNTSVGGASSSTTIVGIVNSSAPGVLSISNNIIKGTTSTATTGGFTGISNAGAVVTTITLDGNKIGDSGGGAITFSAATSGNLLGINNSNGTTTAALSVQNNDLRGITYSAAGSGTAYFINNTNATKSQNISGNTYTSLVINSTGDLRFIANDNALASGGSTTVSNNSIVTSFNKSGAGGIVFLYYTTTGPSSVSGTTKTYQSNNFSNITLTGATTMSGWADLEGASGGGSTKNIIGNTFSNWTCGSGAVTVIQTNYSGNNTVIGGSTANKNTISSISGSGNITGISIGSNSGGASESISFNVISGLSSTGANTTVQGITGGSTGITTMNIAKNKIYNISTSGTGSCFAYGINNTTGSTTNINNNIIGDISMTAGGNSTTSPLSALYIAAGTTVNVYYNTLYLNNTTTTGTPYYTAALYANTTPTVDMRDNILVNLSTPLASSSIAASYYRSGTTLTSYSSNSNNNLFYVAANANSKIYYDGTNSDATLAAYKTRVSTRDAASVTENPTWVSTTGSNANYLHINTSTGTQIESGGTTVSGYTDDFDGDTRNVSTPDIGADEFTGVALDVTAPTISYTPLSNACVSGNRTLSATITDASGVPQSGAGLPVLYWKINAGSYTAATGTWNSGTGKYDFSFGTGATAGQTVSYYIVAQDNAGTPNVIASPSAGAAGYTTSPPAASTPPTTPSSYSFVAGFGGTYLVGAGQTYTTITLAVAAYNSATCFTGDVVFSLTDASYAGETVPITVNANANALAGNYKLTIKPTQSATTITGSTTSAIFVLNGADNVVIDGSTGATANTVCPLSAASRNLTITNTNTGTSSALVWLQTTSGADAATGNKVMNCNLVGSGVTQTLIGVGSGSTTISTSSLGTGNNSNQFVNNNISGVQYGIFSQGASAANKNTGTVINQNLINTSANTKGGIWVGFDNGVTISGNNISNIAQAASPDVFGITCGFGTSMSATTSAGNEVINATITNNTIGSVVNSGTFSAYGIGVSAATSGTTTIANNMVYGVAANGTSGDFAGGIVLGGGAGSTTNVYNNSVSMQGTITGASAATQASVCLAVTNGTAPTLDLRNNIFTNTQLGNTSATLRFAAIALAYSTYTALTSDNNDLYVAGAGPGTYMVGTTGGIVTGAGSTSTTLGNWQSTTSKDGASKNVVPVFAGATDLHLNTTDVSNGNNLNAQGATLASVSTDFDCNSRCTSSCVTGTTAPDLGADEYTYVAPLCVNPGSLSASGITYTTANISWAAPGSGSTPVGYNWEIRTTGAGGSGASGLTTSGNTASTSVSNAGALVIGTPYHLYVQTDCGAGSTSSWSGPYDFSTPTCNVPTTLGANTVGSNSANITWVAPASGSPVGYEWEIRTSGAGGSGASGRTDFGSTTAPTVSASSAILSGSTSYSLYVRTKCTNAPDYSAWAGPYAFATTPDCANATVLTCGGNVTATFAAGTGVWDRSATGAPANTCGFTTPGMEAVYRFTPTSSGIHTFSIASVSNSEWVDYLWKAASLGCDNLNWNCHGDNNAAADPTTLDGTSMNLTAGTLYYILLDKESIVANSQTFRINCPCTGTPSAGTPPSNPTICPNATAVLTVTGAATGAGITYQWEEWNGSSWVNAVGGSGATTVSYTTPSLSSAKQYHLKVTCSGSGLSATSTPDNTVNITSVPAVTITPASPHICGSGSVGLNATTTGATAYAWSNSGGSAATATFSPTATTLYTASVTVSGCQTVGTRIITQFPNTTGTLPQNINFTSGTAYSGSNLGTHAPGWFEAMSSTYTPATTVPSGTSSSWTSSNFGNSGTNSAAITLSGTTRDEWIVGPVFTPNSCTQFSYNFTITLSASTTASALRALDLFDVMISNDCGVTWTSIQAFTSANTSGIPASGAVQSVTIPAGYYGQPVNVAFRARTTSATSTGAVQVFIDDVSIKNKPATDIAVTALTAPGTCGGTSSEPVTVTLTNTGCNTITFSTDPVAVTTTVTLPGGGNVNLSSATTNTGTLAPNSTMSVTMVNGGPNANGTLNMTTAGSYTITPQVTMTSLNDGDNTNNQISVVRTVVAAAALPQTTDFTGYTGSNLNTVFPNWYEGGTGATPTSSNSASPWASDFFAYSGSSTAAVINLYSITPSNSTGWIVGPKFNATGCTRLTYKLALTAFASTTASALDANDLVQVKVSTDCGQTWSAIKTYNNTTPISNTGQNETVDLSAYNGQAIIVAFYATEGATATGDDDVYIDDVQIKNGSATDAGILSLTAPLGTTTCGSATQSVTVRLKNYGCNNLTSIPVAVNVTGAVSQNLTGTWTGTLTPGSTVDYTLGSTVNMSTPGIYTFNGSTSTGGDGDATNDAMAPVNVTTHNPAVPSPGTSASPICNGQSVNLTAGAAAPPTTIMSENFNTTAPGWTVGSASTTSVVDWYIQSAPYTDASGTATFLNFTTTNGGGFAYSNSDAGGSGSTTTTVLTSPVFSTVGYTAATLSFEHAYRYWSSGDNYVQVEISTDGGTNWSLLQDYWGTSVGTTTNNAQTTANANLSLSSYLGQPNLRIRYYYDSDWGYYWIVDNVQVTGTPVPFTYAWSSSPVGFTSTAQNPTGVAPTTNTTYTVTVTNPAYSCGTSASVAVNVNPVLVPSVTLADNSGNGNGAAMCDAANITYTATPTNGGSSPTYNFKVNGTSVQNTSSNTLTTSAINNNDQVTCVLTSNATPCLSTPTATSNTITATITACGYVWTGNGANNSWTTAANWNPGVPPNACGSGVSIPASAPQYPPTLTGNVSLGDITLSNNAVINIGAFNLTTCGNWSGGATNSSSVTGTGSVVLVGGNAQTLSGKTNLSSLTVNKTGGAATVTGDINVATALVMQQGTLTNNGSVTLQSTAAGTAYLNNFGGNTGTYNGNLTVERYISNPAKGYRDLSSPVATTVADLTDDFTVFGQDAVKCWYAYNPYPNVQVYDEALSIVNGAYYEGWLSYTGTSNALAPMKGIAARTYVGGALGQPYTIDLTGAPYNGAKSINITKTVSGTTSQDGWNFVGNPYPSPIDWMAVAAMNPSITGSYYIFQTSNEYAGGWGACNAQGACTGTVPLTQYITSSQGFFVQAISSGPFIMNNTVRTTTGANFYKTEALTNEIRLALSNVTDNDEILAYSDINATAGNDLGYDAQKIAAGSTVYMSYAMPDAEYAINVLDAITEQTELPLVIWVTDTGTYTFNAVALNLTGLTAWLKDAETNTLYELAAGPVSLTLAGGHNYSGRYSIVFKAEVASGVTNSNQADVRIYSSGNKLFVERTSLSPATITVSNVLGQQVKEVVSQQEKTEISLPSAELWYAFVKVTENGKVSTAKVLISNK